MNGDLSRPAASARPFYPSVQTPFVPPPHQYGGSATSYRAGRPPPLPGSYMPLGTYGPVLVPPGVVPIPSWSTYSGSVSPAMSPNGQPTAFAPASSAPAFAGPYHSFSSSSSVVPSTSIQKGNVFPVRPREPDCQFYVKTGDCKFGSSCRFNHPDWVLSKMNCPVSPMGLPLRPGVQPCSFYMQNGTCKFGRMCKFDHPIGTMRYSPSPSSLSEVPVTPYMIPSPLAGLSSSFSYTPGAKSESYLSRGASSVNTSTGSFGLIFQQNMPALFSGVQFPLSARPGGDVRQSMT